MQEFVKNCVENVKIGKLDPHILTINRLPKYSVLKSKAVLKLEIKPDLVIEIDVSDYFKED